MKTVASAILADVEPGFQPGGKSGRIEKGLVKTERGGHPNGFPAGRLPPPTAGREARRHFSNRLWENPVKLKNVSKPEDWPFQGEMNVLPWHDAA